jgi:hypothetical protein
MLDQLAPNKENMPPRLESQPWHKSTRVIKQVTYLKGNWRIEDLEEAMDVIEREFTSLRKASQHWNIPLINLLDHFIG